jgi:tRNA(Ile)-lysidine synthase
LPLVETKINKNVREVIARSSNLIAAENEFLQKISVKKYKQIVKKENKSKIIIDFDKFIKIDHVLQRRIYRYIYNKLNNNLDHLYLEHIFEIEKLIKNKKTGRGIDIASGIRVEISYSNLIFFKKKNLEDSLIKRTRVELGKEIKIDKKHSLESQIIESDNFSFSNDSLRAAFDYEKLQLPLFLRNRKPGDKIKPLGMSGHKKVKDILIDQKVPKQEREQLLLVVDAEDKIIWLPPYKISDDYKVTGQTDKVLILKLKYN